MIIHAFLIFSILVSAAVAGEGATSTYVPTDVFFFNCGETSDQVDISGRNWKAEERKILPSNAADASFPSRASFQGSGVSQVPYMTARIFRHDFTYGFPVSPGWKFLRLYFYPTRYGSDFDLAVNSYFSVTVNGFTLLKNFSADLTAKASNDAFTIKEFIVPVSTGHTILNLTFTPSLNMLAFVNGIEIVSLPDQFYSNGGFDGKITPVGIPDFGIDNRTAFETVHRLNTGGQMIDGVNDTGMFRQWLADEEYLLSVNSGAVPNITDLKINYTENTPVYVAPEDVYSTCRTMGNFDNPRLNLNFNLTWLFPVDAGFNYLVRLHFCETLREVNGPGQRVFTIFIGNKVAKFDMDVIQLSGGSLIPVYLDFGVFVGLESGPRTDLRLDLHPYTDVTPKFYDAILNGVEILKLSFPDGNLAGPNPNPNPTSGVTPNSVKQDIQKGKGKSHVLVIILVTVGFAIVLAMFVVVLVIVMKRRKNKKKVTIDTKSKPTDSWTTLPLVAGSSSHTRSTTSLPSDLCRRFSILEIKSATNNFEKKLIVGVGGFGPVYKGRIDGGATLVAVKRLDISSNQGVNEFEAELKMLSMLRHIHLVSLVGYCDDENEMVLVYEYMPHGTLRDHLYKRNKVFDPPLSWKRRLEICIGAARGLQYLHTGAKEMIIHRDIKTTNILLDDNYVAKVSDFGLSKVGLTSSSQTHVSTVVKGSFGYLDPEYYRRQALTEKSDVYSFGVVLFEVLCCRPVKLENVTREETDLIRWVKSNYKKGTVDQIVDEDLTTEITPLSLEKFCEIAVRCVQDRGIERPSMNDVVWALEFALQLHEAAKSKNAVDSLYLPRRDEVGLTTDGDNDLFSKTTGRMSKSVTSDDDSARLAGHEKSGSSWGVFSEIHDPKAR
ncbi:putative receptor-like protein kinase [Raphanus sativus]|uniref:Receptor-like protein kinase At5g39000 n=1 Tax=Raphanus sativus TaxID=3726 RepID=A0A6J0NKP1_RAPSA|nr:putative receptor-like protein kinase At5g39000 [Raphanus sativus]KAJ4902363.1 putative receptor-like protein kinase [Raphanus sativus]